MKTEKVIPECTPKNRADWRKWLKKNHQTETAVWVIFYKSQTGKPSVNFSDAVDEALCFGWIDSKSVTIDAESYKQYFSVRKPMSVWSKLNKEKVAKLEEAGLMQPMGLAMIERAKQNGMWTKLDAAEALKMPKELRKALNDYEGAMAFWKKLSRTEKRNLLQWVELAKLETTKEKRINDIALLAAQGEKPKGF